MPPVVWYFPHVGRVALLLPERASEPSFFYPVLYPLFVASVLCREFIIRQCPLHSLADNGERPLGRSQRKPRLWEQTRRPPSRRARGGRGGAQLRGCASFCGRDTDSLGRSAAAPLLHEKERGAKRTTTQTNFQHWGGKKHIAPGMLTNHPPTIR